MQLQLSWHRVRTASISLLVAASGALPAAAQWTVINLHPAGATQSEVHAISGAQQVGSANNGASAYLWNGAALSAVKLNPIVGNAANGAAAASGRQGCTVSVYSPSQGVGFFSHASLFSGNSQSWLDLHPSDPTVIHTNLQGMDGVSQVGNFAVNTGGGTFSAGRPCMWSGTAASFVDLTPAGIGSGEARGVLGGQQVGATFDTGLGLACMWSGTPESFVNLNPPEAIASAADCLDATYQYGVIGILDPVVGLFPVRWSGTADSWVLLGMDDYNTRWGEVHATNGGIQVGYTTDTDGVSNERACMWSTDPNTFFDINQFLPAPYVGSNALGVWRHADSGTIYIVGYADNGNTGQREAVMWVNGSGVNLVASVGAPADCSSNVGQPLTYTIRVLNAGPTTAGAVTLTVDLPAASVATYAGATPAPTTVTATQATFDLGAIAGAGGVTDVSLTLTAVGAGAYSTITATATTAGEVDPTNNSATGTTHIQPASPANAAAKGLISTNTALANSNLPGGGGHFKTLNHPFASPSGGWWVLEAVTDQVTSKNNLLIRAQTGSAPTIVAQKGITSFTHGLLENLLIGAEVNDSGRVAFAGDDNGATASDGFVATTDGTTITEIAREGAAIPAMSGVNYGSGLGNSTNIFANGQCGFATSSSPSGSNAYLSNNGGTILARQNVTTPGGASNTVKAILQNSTGVFGLALDATGAHSIYQCDLNTSASSDQVIVADGNVVLQEGATVLSGYTTAVDGNNKTITMGGGGTWLVRGSNTNAEEDWVVRGSGSAIQQVYHIGDSIYVGTTEKWKEDGVITATFFAETVDGAGNYVIGGCTSNADSFANSVLVYNNRVLIARENDPVDLDGNGVFDDGVYIKSFNADSVALVQGAVVVAVNLRDEDAALCHTNDTDRGQALLRIPLPCPGDVNGDHVVDLGDLATLLSNYGSNTGGHDQGDVDGNGIIDLSDLALLLSAYGSNCF